MGGEQVNCPAILSQSHNVNQNVANDYLLGGMVKASVVEALQKELAGTLAPFVAVQMQAGSLANVRSSWPLALRTSSKVTSRSTQSCSEAKPLSCPNLYP